MPFFFVKLTPNGRMVAAGAAAGPPPADFVMEMFAAFQESMSFATFSANTDCVPEADRRAATAELVAAARRASCAWRCTRCCPLEQAMRAHQKMEAGEVFGRIVLARAAKSLFPD